MEFSRYTSDLASSPLQKDQRECQSLHNEWQLARCRMWAELVAKFSHFQQLPYKILQLAHHDQSKVIIGAQACLWLWAQGGAGCHHRQSRRFLDPTWKSTAQDPSLLPLVKRLACGEDVLSSPDFAPLVHWLAVPMHTFGRANSGGSSFPHDQDIEESPPCRYPLPLG